MPKHQHLEAEERSLTGKRVKSLRRRGRVPGVVYGPSLAQPRSVTVDARDFELLYRSVGTTALVDLSLAGMMHTVFIREVQSHPVSRELLHVDFYAPNLNQPIVTTVPIAPIGALPSGVDGVLEHGRQDIEVRGLPEQIPQLIEVDISSLTEADAAIHVEDLTVPAGIEILNNPAEMVVKVSAPTEIEEPPVSIEEALEEETADQPAAMTEGVEPVEDSEPNHSSD